jgi:hypothetical protein
MEKVSFNPNLKIFIFISLFFTKSVVSQQSIGNTTVSQNYEIGTNPTDTLQTGLKQILENRSDAQNQTIVVQPVQTKFRITDKEKKTVSIITTNELQSNTNLIPQDSSKNTLKKDEKLPIFDLKTLEGHYALKEVKAINRNSNYTQLQLNQFSTEAAIDYNKFYFIVSDQLLLMYLIDKNDLTNYNVKHLEKSGNNLRVKDCKECEDSKYKIVSLNDNELVLELKPQDEYEKFIYQLIFNK